MLYKLVHCWALKWNTKMFKIQCMVCGHSKNSKCRLLLISSNFWGLKILNIVVNNDTNQNQKNLFEKCTQKEIDSKPTFCYITIFSLKLSLKTITWTFFTVKTNKWQWCSIISSLSVFRMGLWLIKCAV